VTVNTLNRIRDYNA